MTNNYTIKTVVFDLDGTLFSSHKSIYLAAMRTFKEIGMEVNIPEEPFYKLIGHHFREMFAEFGIVVKDLEKFIDIYKNFYFDYIDYSEAYSGIYETIDYLKNSNFKLALLTTKGNDQAVRIMKHFKLFDKFDLVSGRKPGMPIKPSGEPLEAICNELNENTKNCLMVGDSELDILCGKNAGALTAAVTYGYRAEKELIKYNPNFLIHNIAEIKSIVNGAGNE